MFLILKRDGTKVPFDKDKIIRAINGAMLEVDGKVYEYDTAKDIAKVFSTEIPHSVRAAESSLKGVSVYKHDSNSKIANAYRSLVKEVDDLERTEKNRSWSDRAR